LPGRRLPEADELQDDNDDHDHADNVEDAVVHELLDFLLHSLGAYPLRVFLCRKLQLFEAD
jgi:hypothetical protein